MNSIFDIIHIPFGYLISFVYNLTRSYTVAIVVFGIVVLVVLFPLNIKQQKNSQKQAALRPKEEKIRKKYAGRTDRVTQQKMQQEIMDLYQAEHFSPFGGCLPLIVQLVLIICLYTVVQNPLTYVAHLDKDTVENVKTVYNEMYSANSSETEPAQTAAASEASASSDASSAADTSASAAETSAPASTAAQNNVRFQEIAVNQYINNNQDAFVKAYDAKYGQGAAEQFIDKIPVLKLFGVIDLGDIPAQKGLISVPAIFALISLLSAFVGQVITRKYTYQPATDMNNGTMKMMNYMMPLFSGYISYAVVPLAVTIYWIVQNLLRPVQQIILSKMYKIPTFTPEQLKEMERAEKKEQKALREDRPKRRSLVYDDDDDIPAIEPENDGASTTVKEKADPDDSPIEKARLKDDGPQSKGGTK
ncbi:MAG: membrane protein insertase YidC [Clostridia bacterium]|nr:membrane protein insertase YidC [Clostridia bacterium]